MNNTTLSTPSTSSSRGSAGDSSHAQIRTRSDSMTGSGGDPSSRSILPGSSLLGLSTPERPGGSSSSSSGGTLRHKASLLSVRSYDGGRCSSPAPSTHSVLSALEDDDPDAIEDLEDSMRHSGTIDEFTRIITEFRVERKRRMQNSSGSNGSRRGRESSGLVVGSGEPPASRSTTPTPPRVGQDSGLLPPANGRDSFESTSGDVDSQQRRRCTCCCGQHNCERAKRATEEWADMES